MVQQVWLLIILTLAVVTLLFSLYTFYVAGQGKDRAVETISKNFVYAFTLLTGQGKDICLLLQSVIHRFLIRREL
jgi:heme/copper-type cytochrome/quinol oxidase subunit 4